MIGGVFFVMVLAVSSVGFAFYAASQKQHRATIIRLAPVFFTPVFKGSVRMQRWLGAAFLCASLAIAILRDGVGFGLTLWVLTITLSALIVVVILSCAGRKTETD